MGYDFYVENIIVDSTQFFSMGTNVEFLKGHLGRNFVGNFFKATESLVTKVRLGW